MSSSDNTSSSSSSSGSGDTIGGDTIGGRYASHERHEGEDRYGDSTDAGSASDGSTASMTAGSKSQKLTTRESTESTAESGGSSSSGSEEDGSAVALSVAETLSGDSDSEPKEKGPMWKRIAIPTVKSILALACLYFFIVGLQLLGDAFKLFGAKTSNEMLKQVRNPIAGLVVGILATVLVQSSSTSTSIVVGMVSADVLTVSAAIPIVMGANIGTSVTNTLVSLNHVKDRQEFKRAFSGATVHDFFNLLSVLVLLPVELVSTYLESASGAIANGIVGAESFKLPGLSKIVKPTSSLIVKLNKTAIKEEDYDSMIEGGIFKDADLDHNVAGVIVLIIAIAVLVAALFAMVKLLHSLLKGKVHAWIERVMLGPTSQKWYFAYVSMALGIVLTIAVQSSSIVTSALTPLVGMGVMSLEQMFPMTLGANIGTTVTAMLAALVSGKQDGVQIALAHLLFNLSGILIWFPVPFMRKIPLWAATQLGIASAKRRWVAAVYTGVVFFLLPLSIFGLSLLHPGIFWTGFALILLAIVLAVTWLVLHTQRPAWLVRVYALPRVGKRLRVIIGEVRIVDGSDSNDSNDSGDSNDSNDSEMEIADVAIEVGNVTSSAAEESESSSSSREGDATSSESATGTSESE
jgi:solute carrier family 34 (sodium-dependent phosphate cotransporter)